MSVYDRFDVATRGMGAYAILKDGKPVGRAVVKYGNAVTAYLQAWMQPMAMGRAGGGGYDRATAAMEQAASCLAPDLEYPREDVDPSELAGIKRAILEGRDGSRWSDRLEAAGYVLALVIG